MTVNMDFNINMTIDNEDLWIKTKPVIGSPDKREIWADLGSAGIVRCMAVHYTTMVSRLQLELDHCKMQAGTEKYQALLGAAIKHLQ